VSGADKEALAFGLLLIAVLFGGTGLIALQEHQRNASCAELGGIVINLKCGRFEPIEGWKP
jgi:hypothetical protein